MNPERQKVVAGVARFDMEMVCVSCDHPRYEHDPKFGCMNWDGRRVHGRRVHGWCDCNNFQVRESCSDFIERRVSG